MANFASIQERIYYGYTQAAIRLGTEHAIYRAPNLINPIQLDNFLKNTLISIDYDYKYSKAKKYGDPVWQFLPQNGLTLQNYDFIVGTTVTYFIIDIAPEDRLTPPVCVECNGSITITHPNNSATLTPGSNTYQQYQPGTPAPYVQNCPASILQHTRTDTNNMKLPTSVKLPYYSILLPEFDDLIIKTGDEIDTDTGRRLVVINAERTKRTLGFRIVASELGV